MKAIIFCAAALFSLLPGNSFAQLPQTSLDISPLLIGESVPDAELISSKGEAVMFSELLKEKPTVVFFYRGNWCSNCITHFSQEIAPFIAEIRNMDYNLIAISPDMPDTLLVTAKKTKIDPGIFYSDGTGTLSSAIGISFQQNEKMKPRILAYSGGKNTGFLPVPSIFVINTEKKITFEYINPNGPGHKLRIRGSLLMAVLKELKTLQPAV